jgi:hypothetical protein
LRFVELQRCAANTPAEEIQALQVTYDKAQGELEALQTAAIQVCQEIEGAEGHTSGSSITSRLRALGGRVFERLRGALHVGVQKTLGLTSTYYKFEFDKLRQGYLIPEGVQGDDAEIDAIREADADVAGIAAELSDLFEGYLFPDDV